MTARQCALRATPLPAPHKHAHVPRAQLSTDPWTAQPASRIAHTIMKPMRTNSVSPFCASSSPPSRSEKAPSANQAAWTPSLGIWRTRAVTCGRVQRLERVAFEQLRYLGVRCLWYDPVKHVTPGLQAVYSTTAFIKCRQHPLAHAGVKCRPQMRCRVWPRAATLMIECSAHVCSRAYGGAGERRDPDQREERRLEAKTCGVTKR